MSQQQPHPKNRRRKHRRRRPAVYILVSMVLIAAAVGLALSLFFKINRIEVTGSSRYTDSELIAASGVQEGDNLFFFDSRAAAQNITGRFPYVAGVRILRQLPGTLVISVTERKPVALIADGSAHWLIDGTGRLLEQVSGRSVTDILTVTGVSLLTPTAGTDAAAPKEQEDGLRAMLTILDSLERSSLLNKVSAVDVSKSHELRLTYDGGRFDVMLGDAADLDVKLPFMLAYINELPLSARGSLDVSCAASQKRAYYQPRVAESSAPAAVADRPPEQPDDGEPEFPEG